MSAIDYVPHGRLAIGSGSTLRLDDSEGMLLYVWHGSVWLTQERDRRDHLLKAGDSFRLDRAGTALISPFREDAVVGLTKPRPERRSRVGALLSALLLAGCARTIAVPESLQPSAGESLKRILPAKGVQVYECREGSWAFVAPEADLYDSPGGKVVGRHYAGPTWESMADGSRVTGSVKRRADAPLPGAIPWLLLSAKSAGREGTFGDVTSIQRVATRGGAAPAGGCAQPGTQARVEYTADYYFYGAR